MKVVCAWCQAVIQDDPANGPLVSHGMCHECAYTYVQRRGIGLRQMIGQLSVPVLVMDHDAVVLAANAAATATLQKPVDNILTRRGGVVIDCANAGAPGGCGHSTHCDGCRLRAAITGTHQDGQPRYGVVSEHPLDAAPGGAQLWLRFSTSKVQDAVVLTLEGAEVVKPAP